MNESDPRSDVHYLGSSENKAWKKKKFRPVWDNHFIMFITGLFYVVQKLNILSIF